VARVKIMRHRPGTSELASWRSWRAGKVKSSEPGRQSSHAAVVASYGTKAKRLVGDPGNGKRFQFLRRRVFSIKRFMGRAT